MVYRANIKRALYFTKMSVYLARTWPPSINATKWETIKYNIAWFVSLLSSLCLLIPLFISLSKYRGNSLIFTQSVCFAGAASNLIFKMIIYRMHIKRTQTLICEMEEFLVKAEPHEIQVMQRYLDRCSGFHVFISTVNYLTTAVVFIATPFNPDQTLPTYAVYPFSVESGIPMYLAYLHQIVAGFQNSAGVTVDCQVAMKMWFACARLEILASAVGSINDIRGFEIFVRQHREILSYAVEVSKTMGYIALSSSIICGIGAIMSSVQFFGDQPLHVKLQFGPATLICAVNLFICAWPADHMITTCDFLGNAVYNNSWHEMPRNIKKNIPFLLERCQRPIVVSIPGILPTLSLRSYASFLSTVFSYFTTVRLVMMKNDET